jgi:hypothetical protein
MEAYCSAFILQFIIGQLQGDSAILLAASLFVCGMIYLVITYSKKLSNEVL